MKKALLPLMIASLVPAAALADVNVYGKVSVSLQQADWNNYTAGVDGSYTELRNNESRFGIKGSEVIDDDLKAIYQYEFKVEPNDTTSSMFGQRNIFVGLQGTTWGTVQAGRFDTPMKLAQEKNDVFKDMQGDWKLIIPGESRGANTVQYSTPAIHFVTGTIAYISGETDAVKTYKDAYSASVVYNTPSVYVALASDHNVDVVGKVGVAGSDLPTTDYGTDLYRLVGRYTIGKVVLGAMYEAGTGGYSTGLLNSVTAMGRVRDTAGDFIHHSGYNVSAIYNVDAKWALKAQFTGSDFLNVKKGVKVQGVNAYAATDATMLSVGADYALNKKTKLQGYYTAWKDDNTDVKAKHDDQFVGVGVELSF
jgi:predicted porin